MGGRWALYCSSASVRNFGRPASKAHTMASGLEMSMNLSSMAMKPNTALVGVPSGAFMVGGHRVEGAVHQRVAVDDGPLSSQA